MERYAADRLLLSTLTFRANRRGATKERKLLVESRRKRLRAFAKALRSRYTYEDHRYTGLLSTRGSFFSIELIETFQPISKENYVSIRNRTFNRVTTSVVSDKVIRFTG